MTDESLRQLAEHAVRAGALPTGHVVPASITVPADTSCSLCGERLGHDPAFRLTSRDRNVMLHAECFGAWLDVVIVGHGSTRK